MKTESDFCMEICPTFFRWRKTNYTHCNEHFKLKGYIFAIQKMMAICHVISELVFIDFAVLPEDIEKFSLI